MELTKKRVLITAGGAGSLAERVLAEGNDVRCVDNYFTGRKANIAHLLPNPSFEAMRHDVCFPLYVDRLLTNDQAIGAQVIALRAEEQPVPAPFL